MTPHDIDELFDKLEELVERLTRLETRVVKLMIAQGVNPHTGEKA